jgi:oligosaccharyl transferase complex subunit OST4
MISDNDLYRLAMFLGGCAMFLIILYHFLEVNAKDESSSSGSTDTIDATTNAKRIPPGADPVGFTPAAALGGTSGKSASLAAVRGGR